ncbi:MAG: DUF1538 domain-containing protein [Roseburia hominis]
MNKKLKEKFDESVSAVLPITVIVLLLSIFVVPMETGTIALFLVGAFMLIIGMAFFQLGAEMAMTPLGEGVGSHIMKTKRLSILIIVCFVMGVIITIAEPDLQVLANQVPSIPNETLIWTVALGVGSHIMKTKRLSILIIVCFVMGVIITIAEPDLQVLANQVPSIPNETLIWTVALGVGVFLVIAVLRIIFKLSLPLLLCILYAALFLLSFAAPADFIAVAFDSGGVTTGPMTVPFIMAIGVGLSSTRSDKDGSSDSFGLISFCSIGPIAMVLLLGIFYHPAGASYNTTEIPDVVTMQDVMRQFVHMLPDYGREVISSILPVLIVFLLFQLISRRYHKNQMIKMLMGFLYTIIGLILFLTGVNVGFAPVGSLLGSNLAAQTWRFVLIPIGALIGYYIVKAEPAVQVLNKQVEDVTNGSISRSAMNLCLSIGVSASVALALLRVLTGLNIYWLLIPGYIIALVLTRFVPKVFVGIAFDSGGVASGPMTSTFLLPLAMGACTAVGGNVVTDAFGVVAMVAMAPLIAIQIMGVLYQLKLKRATSDALIMIDVDDNAIMDIEEE